MGIPSRARRAWTSRLGGGAPQRPAGCDELTGLPDRSAFRRQTTSVLARARDRGNSVALIYLDLDGFHQVNDSFTHDGGDELLRSVSRRLQGGLREGATVGRMGGDEFALIFEDVTVGAVLAIADRLQRELAAPHHVDGSDVHSSASIGIAMSAPGEKTEPELLRDADAALCRAKDRGKDRVELFDSSMRGVTSRRLALRNALHAAVERQEFRVHYQPEIDLTSGAIVGAEALVRWQRTPDDLVPPGEFIPLAEESGLIEVIGDWVLGEAVHQAARWARERPGAALTVWVNLAARQFAQAGLVDAVREHLRGAGLAAEHLGLEITESALLEDSEGVVRRLQELKALGVRIAVDDFGTGYSSLNYLKRLPVDAVKIDRSFVAGLGTNADDSAIVGAIVGMARALRLTSIAEGVETEEQLAELRALGCDSAQGYLFATPQPRLAMEPSFAPATSPTGYG